MEALLERTFHAEHRHFWFRGFRRFVIPLIEQATRGVSHPKLVDAGCGTGANLALLDRFGSAFGVELSRTGLQFARARGIARIAQGSVTDLPFPDDSIDVVVSFDVLYCLDDRAEQAAIAEMFRVLRPGGSAIVNAAALDMLKGDHSALGGEVRRYTTRRLRSRLERAGFAIERLTYTNACLFPITAAVRSFQRLRGVRDGASNDGDLTVPFAPVNAIFAAALAMESKVIAAGIDMPVGSSVLCRATKPG